MLQEHLFTAGRALKLLNLCTCWQWLHVIARCRIQLLRRWLGIVKRVLLSDQFTKVVEHNVKQLCLDALSWHHIIDAADHRVLTARQRCRLTEAKPPTPVKQASGWLALHPSAIPSTSDSRSHRR